MAPVMPRPASTTDAGAVADTPLPVPKLPGADALSEQGHWPEGTREEEAMS